MSVGTTRFIKIRESGALSVVQFRISITAPTTNIHDVQEEITDFVARHECQKLVFDLSSTSYLPSSVIGILVVLSSKGVEVHLANASADIASVIDVMGLSKRLRVNEIELPSYEPEDTSDERSSIAIVKGYFTACPECESRQRIDKHLLGKHSECTNCRSSIHVDSDLLRSADELYCTCPKCERELLFAADLATRKVECEFCGSGIQVRKVL